MNYAILIKVTPESIATGQDVRDAEYLFLDNMLSEEKAKEFIKETREKSPENKWEEVKVCYLPKQVNETIYFWVKAFILTDKTAVSNSKSIVKGIETYYRQKAIDILAMDNPEEYVAKMMKVHDAGIKAMKTEAKNQFGMFSDTADNLSDGEVEEGTTDLDSILDQIEGGLKDEE